MQVAAAVLFDAAGRVLIGRRPEGKPMAGFWEFPGGKLDAGEDAVQALERELSEELGIGLEQARPLITLRNDYPDRTVVLEVFIVDSYKGEPAALEGQALRWVRTAELSRQQLLPADAPIVDAIMAYEGTAHGAGHRLAGHSAR
jgi:8-oxo-dGTP diphosphatase